MSAVEMDGHEWVSVASLGAMGRQKCARCGSIATLVRDDAYRVDISDHSQCAGVTRETATGEPTFILRANDPIAPMAVRLWASQSWQQGGDPEKIAEARAIAEAMNRCHREHR